jgi:hypothetical protein
VSIRWWRAVIRCASLPGRPQSLDEHRQLKRFHLAAIELHRRLAQPHDSSASYNQTPSHASTGELAHAPGCVFHLDAANCRYQM